VKKGAALEATLKRWAEHPAAMVREEFHAEPDAWQEEALELFPHSPRLAMKACKGPGKTAVLAWLGLNFLGTRPHPRIGATSITESNLNANLWPELAKWMQVSPYFTAQFEWTKTAVVHRAFPATWFMQARGWPKQADPEQQSNALAGLHAPYVMWLADESGGMPQAIMTTMEAIFSSCIEGHVIQSGNPTHTTGPLYRACTTDRHLWRILQITGDPLNPKRSPRISLEWANQQIASYGRDNPWVMVNVLGEFPPASINSLLGVEDVEKAIARHLPITAYEWSQKRLGVDVARFGDDRTVLFPRQGLAAFRPKILRNMRTTDIAAQVAKACGEWFKGDDGVIFVDDTGHWGHGVIDNLVSGGIPNVIPLVYSAKALNPRYKNRRVEFWLEGAEWVKNGGALPNVPDLVAELTEPTYTFVNGVFVLEEKDQIKDRLGRSPDLADALFETFGLPDMPNEAVRRSRQRARAITEFEPFAQGSVSDFDPYEEMNR
jgi:phage terminase large subunit